MKNKILHFTKADIQNAGPYMDNNGCLACTAIRRQFRLPADALVRATGYEVGFARPGKPPQTFEFCEDGANKISNTYLSGRVKPNTKPFQVELRPIAPAKFGCGWDRI